MSYFKIPLEDFYLAVDLRLSPEPKGLVIFPYISEGNQAPLRNQTIARHFEAEGLSTLSFNIFTEKEEKFDKKTKELRRNVPLLVERLLRITDWGSFKTKMPIGYFGANILAAAAFEAAVQRKDHIKAIVSNRGRLDLVNKGVFKTKSPTLLIVGGQDLDTLFLNEAFYKNLKCEKNLEILHEEPQAPKENISIVSHLASNWFRKYLTV